MARKSRKAQAQPVAEVKKETAALPHRGGVLLFPFQPLHGLLLLLDQSPVVLPEVGVLRLVDDTFHEVLIEAQLQLFVSRTIKSG